MTPEETVMARHQKRLDLLACGKAIRSRDQLIRESHAAGLMVAEIAELLGMSRQQVSAILHPRG